MHCSKARFVYNLGLEQRNLWRKDRTARINYRTQAKELAEARQAFTWLTEGSSAVGTPRLAIRVVVWLIEGTWLFNISIGRDRAKLYATYLFVIGVALILAHMDNQAGSITAPRLKS